MHNFVNFRFTTLKPNFAKNYSKVQKLNITIVFPDPKKHKTTNAQKNPPSQKSANHGFINFDVIFNAGSIEMAIDILYIVFMVSRNFVRW